MARRLYRGVMRARVGEDEGLFEVDWSWCRDDAKDLPFEIAFASSHFDPDPFDYGGVGEIRQTFYPLPQTTVPPFLRGDHFCGTQEQWQQGWPDGTPMPALIDGVPCCCVAGLDGAYDCGYDFGYLTGGDCCP